jgi:hypothetical protein
MIENDGLIINGVRIYEDTDNNIIKQLLKKNGAEFKENLIGSLIATGPFSVSYREDDDEFFGVKNFGSTNIRSANNVAILYSFNNFTTGTLSISYDALDKIFIQNAPDTYGQETKKISLG